MSDEFTPEFPAVSVWPKSVRSVVVHVLGMAHYAMAAARGWAANSIHARVRLTAQNNGLNQEVELLREELRIKDARAAQIPARHRPRYHPDHVHHVDLTVVPTSAGLWASWLPLALPQAWPFAWWVVVVIDHYSRRAMGVAVFGKQPTSLQVRMFLGRIYAKGKPKYIVCDKGSQFWRDGVWSEYSAASK